MQHKRQISFVYRGNLCIVVPLAVNRQALTAVQMGGLGKDAGRAQEFFCAEIRDARLLADSFHQTEALDSIAANYKGQHS